MSRILNRQRSLAEAGRLRLGLTVETSGGKTRPTRSETWIFTSPDRDKADAAATLWGGDVEHWQPMGSGGKQWRVITNATSVDAILPPGDPLSEAYETWSKGGAQRRCNGVTEQFTGSPCLCAAQYGERWYEQPKGKVCDAKSRLKVLIPDLPGLGSYRMETGSYYASMEIGGMVDFIRSAVGEQTLIPVRLRIEQRTRVVGGETKHFPVPVLELRGVTTGELLGASASQPLALDTGTPGPGPLAVEAARPDYQQLVADATTVEELQALWRQAGDAGHLTDSVKAWITARAGDLKAERQERTEEPEATAGDDRDAVWMALVVEAGRHGVTDSQLREMLVQEYAQPVEDVDAGQLQAALDDLRAKAGAE